MLLIQQLDVEQLSAVVQNAVRQALADLLNSSVGTPEANKQWLSLEELCDYLPGKPAKSSVYAWVAAKRIPFHKNKNTKRLIFHKPAIDLWLSAGREKTVEEIEAEAVANLPKLNRRRG